MISTIAFALLIAATPGPASTQLLQLLDERLRVAPSAKEAAQEIARIDGEITKRFEKPLAVMITDMTGFTERTNKRGILSFLATIRQVQQLALPVLKKNGATLIKTDADDLFVVHDQPLPLFHAAQELLAAVKKHNADSQDDIGLAVGLDLGPVLQIGDEDIFGAPVNIASKLGEDTAKGGEILLSVGFYQTIESTHPNCKRVEAGVRATKFPFYECH